MEAEYEALKAWGNSPVPWSAVLLIVVILLTCFYLKKESFNPTALARGQALDTLGQTGQGLGPNPGCGDVLRGGDTWAWMNKAVHEQMANKGAVPGGTRRKIDDADLTLAAMGQS